MRFVGRSSLTALLSVATLVAGIGAANAGAIQIVGMQPGDPSNGNCGTGLHSNYLSSSVTEINFDSLVPNESSTGCDLNNPTAPGSFSNFGAPPATIGTALGTVGLAGNGEIVAGTYPNVAAQPWADSTPYLGVPGPDGSIPGLETLSFNGAGGNVSVGVNYVGLYWGSVDSGNGVTFALSDGSTVSFYGSDLPNAADALSYDSTNQFTTGTNVFVDFETIGGVTINSVTFTDSPNLDYELDNVAFGAVPAPASLALLGLGLIGLGAMRRHKAA